jgi:TonB-linked SusC/RagA family outer membrane protein
MKKTFLLLMLFAVSVSQLWAQVRTIQGKVVDEEGLPVPGASVQVQGTSLAAASSTNGEFRIADVPESATNVEVRFIGYRTAVVPIGSGTINVQLHPAAQALEDVVVVGYGTQRREAVSGSTTIVSAEELENKPFGSFQNMLQGKAPGLQVTAINGRPGQNAYLRVRGVGSLNAGSAPLIVIDGQPVSVDAYNALNPNDIENISVLKDASTASIYGSRASNGVLMITTKNAKRNQTQLSYTLQHGVKSKTQDNFRMMSFDEKVRYEKELGYANEYMQAYMDEHGYASMDDIPKAEMEAFWADLKSRQNTDWMRKLLRPARFTIHDVSVSSGTDRTKIFFSLQDYREEGISYGSDFTRRGGRLNVSHEFTDWFDAGANVMISNRKESLLRDIYNVQNPFVAVYTYNPYEPVYNADGSYNLTHQGFSIAEAIARNPERANTVNSVNTFYGQLKLFRNLKFRTELGTEYTDYTREYFIQPGSILDFYTGNPDKPGNKSDNGFYRFNYRWSNTLNYNKTFGGGHALGALVGTEYTQEEYKSYVVRSIGYPNNNNNTQNVGAENTDFSTAKYDWTLASYFGRLEYNYRGKYFVNGSIRRDGSSRFAVNNKYGNFYAGGASWVISRENFLKDSRNVNMLRLFVSTGTSGNFDIGNYEHLTTFGFGRYNGLSVQYPMRPGNPNLTWEKSMITSGGVDFGFFDTRLTGTIAVFQKNTTALLLDRPLSATTGFTSRLENVGELQNRGLEFNVNVDVIRTRDFLWSVGGNVTFQRNEITALYGNDTIPQDETQWVVGQPVNTFYLVRSAGVDPQSGAPMYYTKDGAITDEFSTGHAVLLEGKSPDPRYFGSINTAVSYKGLTLSGELFFSGGNYILNYPWRDLNGGGDVVYSAQAADALDYWKKPGDNAKNPDPSYTVQTTDRWLQKGDYIRLRNVTLSYTLPSYLPNKIRMQKLSFFVQGQNLFYKAKEYKGDPEVGLGSEEAGGYQAPGIYALYSYPQVRSISFGLNATF